MAAKHSLHVAPNAAQSQFITSQLARGHQASVSDVVRTGLRLLVERVDASLDPTARAASPKRTEA